VEPLEQELDRSGEPLGRIAAGQPRRRLPQARDLLKGLYRAFDETDASLAEINPLIVTGDERVLALDAKMTFDDSALFRHPDIVALRDLDEEDPAEIEASKYDLSYISLDGDIGCLVNGAGLAMATMDIIKLYGGNPANFLDVGGGASTEKVTEAFKIMLKNPDLKAILVNIFGGIMKCDVVAQGVVAAARQVSLKVPLVVRLEGTNVDLGKKILAESGLPIISANNMADAAQKVVAAAKARRGIGLPVRGRDEGELGLAELSETRGIPRGGRPVVGHGDEGVRHPRGTRTRPRAVEHVSGLGLRVRGSQQQGCDQAAVRAHGESIVEL